MRKLISLSLALFMLLAIMPLSVFSAGAESTVLGDVNGNSKIDMPDYILIKRTYFGTFTPDNIDICDVNGNGVVDPWDFALVQRAYFGVYDLNTSYTKPSYDYNDIDFDSNITIANPDFSVQVVIPEICTVGEAFDVTVTVYNENMLSGVAFGLEYDNTQLELANPPEEGSRELAVFNGFNEWNDLSSIITLEDGTNAICVSAVTGSYNGTISYPYDGELVFTIPFILKEMSASDVTVTIPNSNIVGYYIDSATYESTKYIGVGSSATAQKHVCEEFTYDYDDYEHWEECQYCSLISNSESHIRGNELLQGWNTHYYECTVCGYYMDSEEHIPNIEAATCQQDRICTICDYVMNTEYCSGEWTVTTAAQVGKEGLLERYCDTCGELLESAPIPALWEGEIADGFSSGSGTEEDPYIIMNAAELAYLSKITNEGKVTREQYFKLGADIVLNDTSKENWIDTAKQWTPIGFEHVIPGEEYDDYIDICFEGQFEGDNHTISGLYINNEKDNQALFVSNYRGGIYNLGVINSYVSAGNRVSAIDAGYEASMNNCYNASTVIGNNSVGGVAVYAWAVDCYNIGEVIGNDTVGGVVAYTNYMGSGCYNAGSVIGNDAVGGVVGSVHDGLSDCYNIGSVTGHDYVGGVAGESTSAMGGPCSWGVENSYNTGNVSGNMFVGGIVGAAYAGTENCYNTGTVSSVESAGGIVGWNTDNILNCYNEGTIHATDYNAGGIVGRSAPCYGEDTTYDENNEYNSREIIQGCYNKGRIICDESNAGGIAGNTESPIIDCYNLGTVSATKNAGGIFGYGRYYYTSAEANPISIETCYNLGPIYGSDMNVGGIGGINDYRIENCFNNAPIKAEAMDAGGIAGWNENTASIINCFNNGIVTTTERAGGIVGGNVSGAVLTNCYYAEGTANSAIGGIGTLADDGETWTYAEAPDKEGTAVSLTEKEITNSASFAGFDFETVWKMSSDAPEIIDNPTADVIYYEFDESTYIEIDGYDAFEDGTVITVVPAEKDIYNGTIIDLFKNVLAVTISATKDGKLVIPYAPFEVKFIIPQGYSNNLEVYYMDDKGEIKKVECTVDIINGVVRFETDVTGTYFLVDKGESTAVKGDINGNEEIDSLDYILLKRAYFGTFALDDTAKSAGDINGNGEIDSLDYILLKRAYFGTYEIK